MSKLNFSRMRRSRRFLGRENNLGFTLIEVMVSLLLMTIGLMAFLTVAKGAIQAKTFADGLTNATILAVNKMEDIKGLGTNEPNGGGAFGFSYLISNTDGYLSGMTRVDDWTYTKSETLEGFERTLTIETYPAEGGDPSFETPGLVSMIKVAVVSEWKDKGVPHDVQLETIFHRRQFLP